MKVSLSVKRSEKENRLNPTASSIKMLWASRKIGVMSRHRWKIQLNTIVTGLVPMMVNFRSERNRERSLGEKFWLNFYFVDAIRRIRMFLFSTFVSDMS